MKYKWGRPPVRLWRKGLNGRLVKNTMATWLLLIGILLTFIAMSCKEDEPEIIDNIKPGKRDYVWSIDSVDYGNRPSLIQLESIWGSSPTDVWGAAGDAGDQRDRLWHFDGIKWSRDTTGIPTTNPPSDIFINAVWGSAKNDVWAFGIRNQGRISSTFIMHFDGTYWNDVTPTNIVALHNNLYKVYGGGKNNIWVGGFGCILHYDGSNWTSYMLPDFFIGSVASNSQSVYFTATQAMGGNYILLYRIIANNLVVVDSTMFSTFKFGTNIWATSTKLNTLARGIISTAVSKDGGIDSSKWTQEFQTNNFFTERYIQSAKNIFAVGQGALVYHFNGEDWKQLVISVPNHTVSPNTWFWGVWTDANEVFISDWLNGIVYHGR